MVEKKEKYLIVIAGPTAVGKTRLTVDLAKILGVEVINADSRQIFKEMKIGTARPTTEEMAGVVHHFVGSRNLSDNLSAGIFEREVISILNSIYQDSDLAILSGGSGLYIKAVCEGFDEFPEVDTEISKRLQDDLENNGLDFLVEELRQKDPEYWEQVDTNNPQRVFRALEVIRSSNKTYSEYRKSTPQGRIFRTIKIGLDLPRDELYQRIDSRMDKMISDGLFQEAKSLYSFKNEKALQTVGYQEIFGYMDGNYDKEEAIRLLKRNSRRFAKRQLTWFRKDPEITWFHPKEFNKILEFVRKRLSS